jgi:cytoskeletal protein RodZ
MDSGNDDNGLFEPGKHPSYISLFANIGLFFLAVAFGIVLLIAFYDWLYPPTPPVSLIPPISPSDGNLLSNPWWWAGGLLLLLALLLANTFLHQKLGARVRLDVRRRNLILAFGSIFLLVAAVSVSALLTAHRREFTYELVFILAVCVLPAATYYLFLMSRRPSILNEFISNLKRFGLLERLSFANRSAGSNDDAHSDPERESYLDRSMRVNGYFLRFEAMYGQLRFARKEGDICNGGDFVAKLLDASDAKKDEKPADLEDFSKGATLLSDIFRANLVIPLGITTVLCLVGWFTVLNPQFQPQSDMSSSSAAPSVTQVADSGTVEDAPDAPIPVEADESADEPDEAETASTASDDESPSESNPPEPAGAAEEGKKIGLGIPKTFEFAAPTSRGLEGPQGVMEFGPAAYNFAFLGAYFFGIQMLFRRFVHRDLGPNAFLAFATRIILAVIGVSVVIYCLPDSLQVKVNDTTQTWRNIALVVAFTVGFFPQLLWKYIRAVFTALNPLKFFVVNADAKQPLSQLDGLTVWQEVRLEEEDVENVPNMASADVVDLMLRTRIPSERLVFWVDQAILLSVLGWGKDYTPKDEGPASKLRDLGIKTATQFYDATEEGREGRDLIAKRLDEENAEGKLAVLRRAMELEPNFRLVRNWRKI